MKKIMVVFGTRPEAIKMCPLIKELYGRKDINVVVCVTGQHKEMLNQVLDVFGVKPDYNLNIMKESQTLYDITNSILLKIKDIFETEKPDVVLVHGDTSTSFATAMACYYSQVDVGHVEAGLRTYNIFSPYPEEFNRQAIDIISKYSFAPTQMARENLIREGKAPETIFTTGNTVIDAMKYTVRNNFHHSELEWIKDSKFIFITAHRRENIGEPMRQMFRAIKRVLDEHSDCKAIYPIHMNPKVRLIANEEFKGCDRIHMIEPIDVVTCHNFEARCFICLTDSGGIQEECTAYGRPVLVMRDTTERQEGVDAGILRLVGVSEESIYRNFKELIEDENSYKKMTCSNNPYGDGKASIRIADILQNGTYSPWQL